MEDKQENKEELNEKSIKIQLIKVFRNHFPFGKITKRQDKFLDDISHIMLGVMAKYDVVLKKIMEQSKL